MEVVANYGRLPEVDEFHQAPAIIDRFGSLKRAFAIVRRITGDSEWEQIAKRRSEDMLVYLALARFRQRPPISLLPPSLQRDIRAFFGSYSRACAQADELLFGAGNAELVDAACKRSMIGKLLPDSLYVHRNALDHLEPILRVYEGCARATWEKSRTPTSSSSTVSRGRSPICPTQSSTPTLIRPWSAP